MKTDNNAVHNINVNIGKQYNPYKTNTYAIWSIILACTAFIFGWGILAVVAIVLGNMAIKQIKINSEQGESLATAGIILGWINIILTILAVLIILVFVAGIFSNI